MKTLRFSRCFFACTPCAAGLALYLGLESGAQAQLVVLDDFEVNEGHFASNPNTGSGTSQGFFKTAATTADRVTTDFFDGLASQWIVLDDDPSIAGTPLSSVDSWRLRNLSGGGTPANNIPLTLSGNSSYVGYWLKTSSVGMEAGIGIDDGAALEIGRWQTVPADGQWHLYEWHFQDANDWDPFAGTGSNGQIDGTTVTIDSTFFRGGVGFPTGVDFDAQFFLDRVAYNPTGSLAVPEPASVMLLGFGGLILGGRRRRNG